MLKALKRIQYNAPVILTYALLSLIVLGINQLSAGKTNMLLFSVYRAAPTDPLTYLRLFTHVLGHVDVAHYLNNFIIILLIGPMLEEKYGSKSLSLMIVITALITGLLFIAMSAKILIGASGVVFMLMLLSSFTNLQKGRIPMTLLLALAVFIGREALSGVSGVSSNTAHMTHIFGGLCGAAFGYIINRNQFKAEEV